MRRRQAPRRDERLCRAMIDEARQRVERRVMICRALLPGAGEAGAPYVVCGSDGSVTKIGAAWRAKSCCRRERASRLLRGAQTVRGARRSLPALTNIDAAPIRCYVTADYAIATTRLRLRLPLMKITTPV